MRQILEKIVPFIVIGIAFVLSIVFFSLLAYIIALGLVVGLILYAIAWLKAKFSKQNSDIQVTIYHKNKARPDAFRKHRVFDYDDFKDD